MRCLRRPTAIKLLAPGTEGERSLARFEREVQLTAGLTHPSTIAIYDYGRTAEGTFYYAMELLRGINLLQLVAFDGPLPPARVVHFLKQACGALTEAHAAGLIHRDIKPANLMICVYGGIPDFLKVLDFGLVKDIGAVERVPEGDGEGRGRRRALAGRIASRNAAVHGARRDERSGGGGCARGHLRPRRRRVLSADRPLPLPRAHGDRGFRDGAAGPASAGAGGAASRTRGARRDDPPLSRLPPRVAPGLGGGPRRDARGLAVTPPWSLDDAKTWWRDRGPAALEAARGEREERGQILVLSSRSGGRRPQ